MTNNLEDLCMKQYLAKSVRELSESIEEAFVKDMRHYFELTMFCALCTLFVLFVIHLT